jgi:hypothetical protein
LHLLYEKKQETSKTNEDDYYGNDDDQGMSRKIKHTSGVLNDCPSFLLSAE